MRYRLQAGLILAAVISAMAVVGPGSEGEAHHYDQGHTGTIGFILNGLPLGVDWTHIEMNSRTAQVLKIPIHANNASANWQNALATAQANWNSEMQATTGFDVYGSSFHVFIEVRSGSDVTQCGAGYHGCYQYNDQVAPTGVIYMYDPAFSDQTHRVSDLMHEMGHVLYYADEHYPTYDCSTSSLTSIMGHCVTLTQVNAHDIQDY